MVSGQVLPYGALLATTGCCGRAQFVCGHHPGVGHHGESGPVSGSYDVADCVQKRWALPASQGRQTMSLSGTDGEPEMGYEESLERVIWL